MSGDDLLNDILPMVISGILDPKYITGEESEKDKDKQKEPDKGKKDQGQDKKK